MTASERARLTWWSVVEEIRVWDRITHQRFAPGTYRWAVALRNRVIIWLILLTGTRLAELVRLRVSGAHAHVLRGADGRIEATYHKIHLVPFGEYVPLKKVLFFVEKMVQAVGDFEGGHEYTVMTAPYNGGQRETKLATVICYEIIFPDLVRRFVNSGASVMTTVTKTWETRGRDAGRNQLSLAFRATGLALLLVCAVLSLSRNAVVRLFQPDYAAGAAILNAELLLARGYLDLPGR